MSAVLLMFFSLLTTVGPTLTWPNAERVATCDDADWDVEEAANEVANEVARSSDDHLCSFAWGG